MIEQAKRQASLVLLIVLAAVATAGAAGAEPSVSSKQAEAKRVLAEIESIDMSLAKAVDAYNGAQMRLEAIQEDQRENRRLLKIARANFTRSQALLEQRLLAIYTSGDASVVEILLGAKSLDDLLARFETVDRVSEQDARILREVKAFRSEVRRRERELAEARVKQEQVVAERAKQRNAIEAQLAERRRLLATIKDEIEKMKAAEAARQRRLQAAARQRLSQPATPSADDSFGGDAIGSPPASRYGGVVGIAMQYLGIPYRWGGSSPSTGFDCSGFVMYVYAQVGVSLPHNAAAQYGYGVPVSRSDLQPGDLVFFNGLGHNGIYIGGGQFIHSPHSGDVVKISSLSDSWYARTWVGGRRL